MPNATLSEQLLLQTLSELSELGSRMGRAESQNDAILAGQQRADDSRSTMHARINEIAINVAQQSVEIEQQGERLDALDPIVAGLKDAQLERTVIRRALGKVLGLAKRGYVVTGSGAISAGVAWHQWDTLKAFVLRILGAKVGGP